MSDSSGELSDGSPGSLEIKPPQARAERRKKEKRKKEKRSRSDHRHHGRGGGEGYRRDERPSKFTEHLIHPAFPGQKHRRYDSSSSGHSSRYYDDREQQKYQRRESRKDPHPESPDTDRMLEDLRCKLLMKKNKYDAEAAKSSSDQHVEEEQRERRPKSSRSRHNSGGEYEERKKAKLIEPEDPELVLRRARILDAARRKDELEARREKRKNEKETEVEPKRSAAEAEEPMEIVEVSDQSAEEDETESDSASSSSRSESGGSKASVKEVPTSPLSVGDLEKSERRSRSRSASRSPHSRSRTHSRSRSSSRSHSQRSSHSDDGRSTDASDEKEESDRLGSKDVETAAREEHPPSKKTVEEKDVEITEMLPPYYPAIQGCRSVEEFQCLNRIEEGTYGVVYRARDKRTAEIVALKRLKMEKEKEGFPITSLREINTLLKCQHPNIVTVREIVVGSNMDKIFIVMDYVEHDLKSLMEMMTHKKQSFVIAEVKCLLAQLLTAVAHLHDNWILHRDLKTSNLLLSHKGILKVGDFGLAREYGSPIRTYTPVVVTLWYRAPELLLCSKVYSTPIDVWSVGCIFAELLSMTAVFPGKSEVDQLNRIFKELGTPNEKIWPGYGQLPAVQKMTFTDYPVSNLKKRFSRYTSELGLSLLQGLLTYDPKKRLTAEQALKHSYFKEIPLPIDPSMFPTWPAKSELGLKKAMASSPKPPSGGDQYKRLSEDPIEHNFTLGNYAETRQVPMGPGFSLKF